MLGGVRGSTSSSPGHRRTEQTRAERERLLPTAFRQNSRYVSVYTRRYFTNKCIHSRPQEKQSRTNRKPFFLKKKALNLRYAVCTTRTGCYNLQTLAPDFRVHVLTNRVYQLHVRRHPRRCLASPSSTVTHQFCSRTPAVGHAA